MQEKIGFLTRFLGYELKSAERYRRFVTLVMVASPGSRNGRVKKIVEDTIRNSDILADFDGAALVLMSETNSSGAITAIERYKAKNANQDDLRFSVVTYPSDGGGAEGLLATAFRRLQKATDSQPGSIVMTG
ncbi:MAG: hypothetical protein AAB353_10570 [Candidatus Hydrogenedentota bacterium]